MHRPSHSSQKAKPRSGRRRAWSRHLAAGLGLLLAVTLATPVSAQSPEQTRPRRDVTGVKTVAAPTLAPAPWAGEALAVRAARKITWPQGSAFADLTGGPVRAGTLPVRLGAATVRSGEKASPGRPLTKASVTVYDRPAAERAGVDGLLLSVGRADGAGGETRTTVEVDYSGFAHAYGGDWATRLRLVSLPACVLTTPERPACQEEQPLETTRGSGQTLSADATVPGAGVAVLAVLAGASGDSGSFSATSLAQAGSWNVGAQTGDFSWSYPLRLPPAIGGTAPKLAFSYSSGAIDGRVSTSNNQGGWAGDGWELWPGYVERKYASCADDNPGHKTGDQCWFSDNATLSLSGHAGDLIATGTANVYKLKRDDGTRVEKFTDAARGNGDNDNEYWKVTTTDGMQYFFGYHKLPGWTSGKPVTDSTWTAPVYGNNSGEPCYHATFANASCTQAWRWNLDYAVDPHGNSISYFYGKEAGWYGRDNTASQRTEYVRGGWLDHIDYGTRTGSEYAAAAPLRVQFSVQERCLSNCWNGEAWKSAPKPESWLDTPWDQDCAASPCTGKTSPTFWSARRLASVTAQVRSGAATYRDVESWALRQEFLNAGDNDGFPMFLRGLTRTGHVTTAGGSAVADPDVVFAPSTTPLPNRVDGPAAGMSRLTRFRIHMITTESGGTVTVDYTGGDCTRTNLPTPSANSTRCMPVVRPGAGDTVLTDWFHKYVVAKVTSKDPPYAGAQPGLNNPAEITSYDYLDAPAWHYSDDEITRDKYKTWSDWRGYGQVRVRQGVPGGLETATEYRYLRGMDGDKQPSGTRDVWVSDTWGGSVEDHEALNGFVRQQITYLGFGGQELTSQVMDPWLRGPTATRTGGTVTTKAWMSNTATTRVRSRLAAPPAGPGGWRYVRTTTAFTNDGQPAAVDSFGDEAVSGDETCKRSTYVRNDSTWIIDKLALDETLSGTCAAAATPPAPASVLSRTRTFYDAYIGDSSFGAAPTRGDVVRTEALTGFTGSTPTYKPTTSNLYDAYGRVTQTTDALGRSSNTSYTTDAATGLTVSSTVTNMLGHATTTILEPAWGTATRVTNPNNLNTDTIYDGLGRIKAIWMPGASTAANPSLRYTYLVRASGQPSAVTTERLLPNGTAYHKNVTFLDGFLRARQVQATAPGGGRVVTDTLHNAFGTVQWTSLPYYDATNAPPSTTLAVPAGAVPAVNQTDYDGAGRPVAQILLEGGAEKWRTTLVHDGDRTAIIAPSGGTTTQQIVDAYGRVKVLRQYTSTNLAGAFHATEYTYTPLGQLSTVTDPMGNRWSYTYDLNGRQIGAVDPDSGTTTKTYDAAGQVSTVTNPLGSGTATIAYTYDVLGRPTSVRDDTITGAKRAEWVYDTLANGKGKLTSATRYSGGVAYVSKVNTYDAYSRATSTSVVLPASESALCAAAAPDTCSYTSTVAFKPNGEISSLTQPQAADLASETLTYGYMGDTGLPSSLLSPIQKYAGDIVYNSVGQLESRNLGNTGKKLSMQYEYEESTRRLKTFQVFPEGGSDLAAYAYDYDAAGNLTKLSDTAGAADRQCFTYDYQRRLTEAWTPSSGDCQATRSSASLGGPAPYWHSWTFDAIGNRRTETRRTATTNTTYTSAYPAPGLGVARPHAVTGVTASGSETWNRSYSYDNAGNTTVRPHSSGTAQLLTWDREGRLSTLTQGSSTSSNVYDVDGNRLIRKDADGSKTLYLPGGTEVRTVGTVKTATRYYSHSGSTIAVRTASGVHWITGDHHGTAELTVKAGDLSAAKRRMLPYGEQRGATTGVWAAGMDKGFLGATVDPTELTHVGARQYDNRLGRFITVDPVIDVTDPQQMNGYSYSNNNPTSFSDPTGLAHDPGYAEGNGDTNVVEHDGWSVTSNKLTFKYNTNTGYLCIGGGGGPVCAKVAKAGTPSDITIAGLPLFLKKANELAARTDRFDLDSTAGQLRLIHTACVESATCGGVFESLVRQAANSAILAELDPTAWSRFIESHPGLVEGAMSGAGAAVGGAIRMFRASRANSRLKQQESSSCNSFDGDTRVSLASGATKKIKDVRLGDEVIATDPVTGQTSPMPVTVLHLNQDKQLTRLTIVDQHGNPSVIETTWEHPFWSATRQQWIDASELIDGESLLGADGKPVALIRVSNRTGSQPMYNLTVATLHTYYVLAGDTPVLVHNDTDYTGPVADEVRRIAAGEGEKRQHLDGSNDIYRGKGLEAKKSPGMAKRWADSQVYNVRGHGNLRILVNPHGDVGWVDKNEGNYTHIRSLGTKIGAIPSDWAPQCVSLK